MIALLKELNGLENTYFIFKNINLSWAYAFLNGASENVYSFVIISYFCLVLVPLQLIFVIKTKEINLSTPINSLNKTNLISGLVLRQGQLKL